MLSCGFYIDVVCGFVILIKSVWGILNFQVGHIDSKVGPPYGFPYWLLCVYSEFKVAMLPKHDET